ncbi:hypothetical protein PC121_g24794 [Phytophthora cactorum]|nr:hypothetical protein PC121_g24794 [Phytophthora cactorum]
MVFFERQFNCRIHVLRTDGGGEYKTLDLFCKNTGIARQVSEQRNQASNGKAKRMHRTIMNMVPYQNEPGVEVAATDADEEHTRSERHRGVWVAVHGTRGRRNKSLGERGKPDMIVGKSDEIKGYRVYIPRDKVLVVMQYVSNVETLSDVQNEQLKRVHLDDSEESGGGALRKRRLRENRRGSRSVTGRRPVGRGTSIRRERRRGKLPRQMQAKELVVNSVREPDPKNYMQAIRSRLKKEWLMAIEEKLRALEESGVWVVVVPPVDSHVLHTNGLWKRAGVWH